MKPEVEQLIIEWTELQKETNEIKGEILQKEEALRTINTKDNKIIEELLKLCGHQSETFGLKVDEDTFVVVSYGEEYSEIQLEIVNFEDRNAQT